MALEFNVTEADKFFLGEDKFVEFAIYSDDAGTTPLNITGVPMEWSLKNKDKDPDPGILQKSTVASEGITIVGAFNSDPLLNTQRVRLTFASAETDPFVTSLLGTPYTLKAKKQYRHSLKRRDVGNEGILVYGYWEFKQATEP